MAEEKYIKITDDYYLSTDRYNFIISKKLNCKDKNGENVMKNEAYYGSLEGVFTGLSERFILENPNLLLTNIEKVLEKITELKDSLMASATEEIRRLNHKSDTDDK